MAIRRAIVAGAMSVALLVGLMQQAECSAPNQAPTLTMTELAAEGQLWVDGGGGTDVLIAELEPYHRHEVSIRGFLHRSEEGTWSLASQPSLRSCCIGPKVRATLQVMLDRPFPDEEIGKAVTVTGRFFVEPQWDTEGRLTQLYRVEEADFQQAGADHFPVIPVASFVVVGALAGGFVVLRRRKHY